jgi:hypothetical protein
MIDEMERAERREGRRKPHCRQRPRWSTFQLTLDDKLFRRMFQMPRDSFMTLVETIEESVGKGVFKSELWLEERKVPITDAAIDAIGGFVLPSFALARFAEFRPGTFCLVSPRHVLPSFAPARFAKFRPGTFCLVSPRHVLPSFKKMTFTNQIYIILIECMY